MILKSKTLRYFFALLTFMFVFNSCMLIAVEPAAALFFDPAVSFTTSSVTVTEGQCVNLTVELSRGTFLGATARYSTNDGTATTGADYNPAAFAMLYWRPWSTTTNLTIETKDDNTYEGNETFTVYLHDPTTDADICSPSEVTVTILDNDPAPVISLESSAVTASEADRSATITVNKTGSTTLSSTVAYSITAGTAAEGSDFASNSGTLTFDASETSKTITANIVDDADVESSETFNIVLSSPSNATLGSPSSSVVTISDNDVAPTNPDPGSTSGTTPGTTPGTDPGTTPGTNPGTDPGTDPGTSSGTGSTPVLNLNNTSYSVVENVGSTIVTVNKSTTGAATVVLTTTGSAYTDSAYTSHTITVSLASAETSKAVTVYIKDDSTIEIAETTTITLSSASGADLGSVYTAVLTVNDNDNPHTGSTTTTTTIPVIEFASTDYSVAENCGTTTITLSKSASGEATVVLTTEGSAYVSSAYSFRTTQVSFGSAETFKVVTIYIKDDTTVEDAETLTVTLGSGSGATIGPKSRATVIIKDNDAATSTTPVIEFSSTFSTVGESSGKLTFTVSKSLSGAATVDYTVSGTAVAGTDYTGATSGKLTFAASDTSKTISDLKIIDDMTSEGQETIIITLSNPTGASLGTAKTVLWIMDNDTTASPYVAPPANGGGAVTLATAVTKAVAVTPVAAASTASAKTTVKKYLSSLTIPEDILGHWGRDSIMAAMDRGVISGYADATMKPNRAITRGEAAVIIASALKLNNYKPKTQAAYKDKMPSWGRNAVMTMAEKKLMGGYADGTFQANKPITRAELCTILMQAFPKNKTQSSKLAFVDTSRIPSWATQWVAQAVDCNIVGGYPDKTFQAWRKVTRAETCVMLCKAAGYQIASI